VDATPALIRRAVVLSIVVGLVLTSAACSGHADPSPVSPATTAAAAGPTVVPVEGDDQVQRPERHDVSCIDRTGSVPDWFVRRALHHVAGRIESAVPGPMHRAVFHLRSMSATSYAPEAEIATVEIAAVPAAPRSPPLSENPFLARRNSGELARYQRDRETWLAGLEATRAFARSAAERVRALTLPADHAGTDVLGCLLRAPDLLGTTGERTLFVASDLVPSGPQQDSVPAPGSLAGVPVTVAFYCADLASTCAERVGAFSRVLGDTGAGPVTIVDPQNLGG
jgi:hypothetical protein